LFKAAIVPQFRLQKLENEVSLLRATQVETETKEHVVEVPQFRLQKLENEIPLLRATQVETETK
jgi:hypothetical protein